MAGRRAGLRRIDRRLVLLLLLALCFSALTTGSFGRFLGSRKGDITVGAVEDVRTTLPAVVVEPPLVASGAAAAAVAVEDGPGIRPPGAAPVAARPTGQRLLDPDGRPYGAPIPFDADIPVPAGLVWVLLIGRDARAGEDLQRARADSIHLLAANPATGQATGSAWPTATSPSRSTGSGRGSCSPWPAAPTPST